MVDQVQVSKAVQYVYTVPPANSASVPKLVMYIFAVPGNGGSTVSGQGQVHTSIIRR